jgi:hypothetical protein
MKIEIEINCDNSIFWDDLSGELSRIFTEIIKDKLYTNSREIVLGSRPLIDINGNKVGLITILI